MVYLKDYNKVVMILENSPSLAILELIKIIKYTVDFIKMLILIVHELSLTIQF